MLNGISDTRRFFTGIQVIEILNVTSFRESHRQRIHGMMTMVIAFGPVDNAPYRAAITVVFYMNHSLGFIFRPVQFFHHVNKSPILAQTGSHISGSCHHRRYEILKYLQRFFRDVLGIPDVAVNEIFGNFIARHQQLVTFGFRYSPVSIKRFYLNPILIRSFGTVLFVHVIPSRSVALFQIGGAAFKRLVRK